MFEGFATDYRARAAKLIMEDLLGADDWAGRVRFTSSGSESVELALLIAKLVTGRPPAGGVVMSREVSAIMDRYRWETVSSFAGHPIVMAAVAANIEWMLEERAFERGTKLGAHLGKRLAELRDTHPCVAEVAGAGLLWALEIVRPDGSGERFTPDDRHALPAGQHQFSPSLFLAGECAKRGVALATAPPNTLRIGPPIITTEENIDFGVEALRGALDELARIGAPAASAV